MGATGIVQANHASRQEHVRQANVMDELADERGAFSVHWRRKTRVRHAQARFPACIQRHQTCGFRTSRMDRLLVSCSGQIQTGSFRPVVVFANVRLASDQSL